MNSASMPRSLRPPRSSGAKITKARRIAPPRPSAAGIPLPDLSAYLVHHPDVTTRDASVIAAVLAGLQPAQAAVQLGLHSGDVYAVLRQPHVASALHELNMLTMQSMAHTSLACIAELLGAKSSWARYNAAVDILDRAGVRWRPAQQAPQHAAISINIDVRHDAAAPVVIDASPQPGGPLASSRDPEDGL